MEKGGKFKRKGRRARQNQDSSSWSTSDHGEEEPLQRSENSKQILRQRQDNQCNVTLRQRRANQKVYTEGDAVSFRAARDEQ